MIRSNLIAGLDIGTTKVCAVVGEVDAAGVDILGVGVHPSKGLRKGVVIDIESTVASIEKALEEAQINSNCEITSVYVGISGGHVKSMMSHGVAALRTGFVTGRDVGRVMEAARAVVIPDDRQVVHVMPCEWVLNGECQEEPLGLPGVRLEVNCHVVTAAIASVENILLCCRKAGLEVEGVVFEPVASALAVLMPSERENGVALLDIGGGTTDLIVIHRGAIVHSTVLALGGHHITSDISQVLKVPAYPTAEHLKIRYGAALAELADETEVEAVVPQAREPRLVSTHILAQIIQQRTEEILRLVRAELENSGFGIDVQGIVMTGGASQLRGVDRLAASVFGLPARIGVPVGIGGKLGEIGSPPFATGVGLIVYGAQEAERNGRSPRQRPLIEGMVSRMKDWFANLL